MTTAPNLVVAGHPGLAQKLRNTGRFSAVFDVASATELRDLSASGMVGSPAAFMFAPDFTEDLPDAGVPSLADELVTGGCTVLVHSFFTARGDLFGPGVVAPTDPMSMADLLTTLGAAPPALPAQPDLHPEPPPEPWTPPSPVRPGVRDEQELPENPPEYGEPPIVQHGRPREEAGPEPDGAAQNPEPAPEPDIAVWPPGPAPEPDIAASAPEPAPEPDIAASTPEPAPAPAQPVTTAPVTASPVTASPVTAAPPPAAPLPAAPVASGRRGRLRRPVLAALVVLVLAGTGIGAAGLIGAAGQRGGDGAAERPAQAVSSPPDPSPAKSSRTRSAQPEPTGAPTSTPTAVRPAEEYVPGRVRIVDGRVSIEVTWADRSGGRAAYYVVGGPAGRPPTTLASTPPGTDMVRIVALNPSVDYCLTVVAVVDVDRVGQSKAVCTHRVKRNG